MQSVFAYHFLQSLAFSLLSSLWQTAFLWIAYNLTLFILKPKPSTNFLLLVSVQILGFIWFLHTLVNTLTTTNLIYFENTYPIFNTFILDKLLPTIAVIYLFFVFVFIAKFIIQLFGIRRLKSENVFPVSARLQTFINEVKCRFQISDDVQIKISQNITTPLTVGFIKPVILLPIAAINNLTMEQLEVILLHELAHIKRNDYIINLLILFVNTIMFFNPFSRYIGLLIDKQRELSCDDLVLRYNYSKQLYAEALLNVARLQIKPQPIFAAMTAVSTNQQELKYRIKRILNIKLEEQSSGVLKRQMGLSLFFGISLFLLIGFINVNVKKVIKDGIPVTKLSSLPQPVLTTSLQQIKTANTVAHKAKERKVPQSFTKNNIEVTQNTNTLQNKRQAIESGFKILGKLATENSLLQNVNASTTVNEEDAPNEQNDFSISPAIEKHPTTTVQRFFVPATSKSPASMIVVTTTEKDNGKKVVSIEIEKGESKVE